MDSVDEVQFETDQEMESIGQGFKKHPKKTLFEDRLEDLIIKVSRGYIKDKNQARLVVVALAILVLGSSVYLFFA